MDGDRKDRPRYISWTSWNTYTHIYNGKLHHACDFFRENRNFSQTSLKCKRKLKINWKCSSFRWVRMKQYLFVNVNILTLKNRKLKQTRATDKKKFHKEILFYTLNWILFKCHLNWFLFKCHLNWILFKCYLNWINFQIILFYTYVYLGRLTFLILYKKRVLTLIFLNYKIFVQTFDQLYNINYRNSSTIFIHLCIHCSYIYTYIVYILYFNNFDNLTRYN